MACFCLAAVTRADTIIVRGGSSYSGQYHGGATINFTDTHGIQYQFPQRDVQSLVFSSALDTVTLRSGKSYSGHFMNANPTAFAGAEGIGYQFPIDNKQFRVSTSNVDESNGSGLGKNRRTATFLGGGAALGALLGGVFGGGRGAGIGALAGAGGGTLTQVFTRGKQIEVPAKSVLQFRPDRTMVLRVAP